MIIEYAGIADRSAGPGVVHKVRVWWDSRQDNETGVKRAAKRALFTQGGVTDHAEFLSWDMDAYNRPRINAMVRFRVLTSAEHDRRTELRTRRYLACEGGECGERPAQLVHMFDDMTGNPERALCHACWRPFAATVRCKALHRIKADGRLQV